MILKGFIAKASTLALVATLGLPVAAPVAAQDADGCYDASGCLSATSKWSGSTLNTKVTNNCNGGVYVRVCTRRAQGKPDCGASHIGGNRSYGFSGYNAHSSGDVRWTWVGSMRSSKDWVCSGKVNGFNDPMF